MQRLTSGTKAFSVDDRRIRSVRLVDRCCFVVESAVGILFLLPESITTFPRVESHPDVCPLRASALCMPDTYPTD